MFTWLRNKPSSIKLKEVQIGDGNLTLDLPSYFQVESEEDNTTVVYDPAFTDAIARFSIHYISDEHNPTVKGLAVDHVTQSARKEGFRLKKFEDKRFYTHTEPSQQDDEPAIVQYWTVGFNNAIVVISCWVKQATQNQPQTQNLLHAIEPAIQSLRLSKVQQYKLNGDFHHDTLPLSPEHSEDLDRWRQSVYSFARTFPQGYRFLGADGDLSTIQALLDSKKCDTFILEGMGVIFGDILAKKLDLHWVTESDDCGITPALQYQDTGIMLFAKDMIIKRIEAGEEVDIIVLFNSLIEDIRKLIVSGDYAH
jgi:hypothetical protein